MQNNRWKNRVQDAPPAVTRTHFTINVNTRTGFALPADLSGRDGPDGLVVVAHVPDAEREA